VSDGSKIQWTQATWNWVTGCTRISDGCNNCYIQTTPPFRIAHRKFNKPGIGATTGVKLHSDRLAWPRRWRKPRKVFVNSLGDTFHEAVPTDLIAEAFAVMAACPQHIFQVLTKRHARMCSLLNRPAFVEQVQERAAVMGVLAGWEWPLPNVHLGVSAENQKWYDIRVGALICTPAAVRWISAEPLLGPIDLGITDHRSHDRDDDGTGYGYICLDCSTDDEDVRWFVYDRPSSINWIVAGGESGPGARPCELEWLRSLLLQCALADIPYFCKQLGSDLGRQFGAGPKGGEIEAFPDDLRIRQFPRTAEAMAR
jgi:protein gp37